MLEQLEEPSSSSDEGDLLDIIQEESCHAAMSRWVAEGLAVPRAEMCRREGSLPGPFPIKKNYWL